MRENESNCSICGIFSELCPANISRKTGQRLYRSWCKPCEKARKDAWRHANAEHHNQKSAAWAKQNPEQRQKIVKKCELKRVEKRRVYITEYRQKHIETYRSYVAARRKRVQKATPPWQNLSEIQAVYKEAQKLKRETTLDWHVDHIVPLNGKTVCGLHVPWNLQILLAQDNLAKSNILKE